MTNNTMIDGVLISRQLAERLTEGWNGTDARIELRALLDVPAVERQELKPAVRVCGAGYDAERNTVWMETGVVEMPIMRKVEVGEELVFLSEAQSTIARLEARIAELESGRGEPVAWKFKERVWATGLSDYVWRDQLEDEKPNGDERQIRDIDPLYTAPPAPVAHTMKSVMSAVCTITGLPILTSNQCHALARSLNACLDTTAALNGSDK